MRKPLLFLALAALACGKSDEQKAAEALAEMAKAIGQGAAASGIPQATPGTMDALAAGKAKDAVDFRELKAVLPEELNGMPRASSDGSKTSNMGFTISTAEARYETQGTNTSIKVEITDVGAMTGMAAIAMYAWATTEMSSESDHGYEKTTTVRGYRAYEKVDRQSNWSELHLLVGGRFIVDIEGSEVPIDALKAALDKIDLGKLEGMKGFGM